MKTADVLRAAMACIIEHGWAQGDDVYHTEAHCIVTALAWASEDDVKAEEAARCAMVRATGEGETYHLHEWNDALGRTEDEVLDAFDRAIEAEGA